MKPLESRITALERANKKPLPIYAVTFKDGTEALLDALELHLHLVRMKAGKGKAIAAAARISGTLPAAGTAWEDLQSEISSIT